jgi:hypothetical protein
LTKVNPRFAPAWPAPCWPSATSPWSTPSTPTARRAATSSPRAGRRNNIPFVTPLLRDFVGQARRRGDPLLEIGAYEGRNLAFMDWLIPGRLDVTVIDPWFDETLNPEEKYHAVEPRFHRNMAKTGFRSMTPARASRPTSCPRCWRPASSST